MSYRIKLATSFKRAFKQLKKRYFSLEKDIDRLVDELKENPFQGSDLGGGVRKIRLAIASKGKGKSHGARVITYTEAVVNVDEEGVVTLLYIYDKGDRDTITAAEIAALKATLH